MGGFRRSACLRGQGTATRVLRRALQRAEGDAMQGAEADEERGASKDEAAGRARQGAERGRRELLAVGARSAGRMAAAWPLERHIVT